jgi:hypothetical protein
MSAASRTTHCSMFNVHCSCCNHNIHCSGFLYNDALFIRCVACIVAGSKKSFLGSDSASIHTTIESIRKSTQRMINVHFKSTHLVNVWTFMYLWTYNFIGADAEPDTTCLIRPAMRLRYFVLIQVKYSGLENNNDLWLKLSTSYYSVNSLMLIRHKMF